MDIKTRQELRTLCATDLDSLIRKANAAKLSIPNYFQSISPIPDNKDDTKYALADVLYYAGVRLEDSPEHGITASTWGEVKEKPAWVQRLYIIHQTNHAKNPISTFKQKSREIKKERDRALNLARTYGADAAGSANRPFADTELFNSERGLEFPDPAAVFADTRFPNSTAVRVLEYKPLSADAIARNYAEGTEVDVVSLDYNQTPVGMKRIAAGIEYSHEQDIAGELNADLISEYMEERGAEVVNRRVKDSIKLLAEKAAESTGTPAAVLDLSSIPATQEEDVVLRAIMAVPKRFVWTSVFGQLATVQKWLGLDRTNLYAGPRVLPSGAVVGTDFYAKAPAARYVADVPSDYGIAAGQLLFLDASEASLLHILANSELETQEFINRTRMNEIIWSASMGVSEKYPSQGDAELHPFRLINIGT